MDKTEMRPRWEWFIPRAEALDKFDQAHGFKIVPATE